MSKQKFRLNDKANERVNAYLKEIRKGINNVCEMHMHDSNPSMKQPEFETAYVDKLLGQTVASLSTDMRSICRALAEQKEKELKKESEEQ